MWDNVNTENISRDIYYIHKDHLGSYQTITNEEGLIVEKLSFDPWGRRRNADIWTYEEGRKTHLFDRGFTGHEHLDIFGLINMNGRVYDPWLGSFLSPDPIVQSPEYSQNYNKYSYAFNNPLKYIDPSGFSSLLNTLLQRYDYSGGSFYYRGKYYSYDEDTKTFYGKKRAFKRKEFIKYNDRSKQYENQDGDRVSWAVVKHKMKFTPTGTFQKTILSSASYNPAEGIYGVDRLKLNNIEWKTTSFRLQMMTLDLSGLGDNGEQDGGGDNSGITLNEAATGVSAMSFSNSVKGNLVEWGMKGANWGKSGAQYVKVVRGAGIAGSVFGMGVSGYNMYTDYSQGGIDAVNGWDVADFGVGAAGLGATVFLVSNPVGWSIAGGATIYFGARFVYDISTKP